jgi:hypothetical protein
MAETTNYSLKKPDIGSVGWGDDVNGNFDTIDSQLKTNADNIVGKVAITRMINSKPLSSDVVLTTADIDDGSNKRYCTDAQKTVIGNTSGANTGDETVTTIKTKLGITTLSGSNTGDQPIASQAEAELGSDNTKVMTPLRVAQAIDAQAPTFTGVLSDGTVNPTNLIANGDFESWSAGASAVPDGWTVSGAGASVAREGTIFKKGLYSAKVTRAGADCQVYKEIFNGSLGNLEYCKGRSYTFGCWVYATVANRAGISISDNVVGSALVYHSGNSTWEWLTVTLTVSNSANTVYPQLRVSNGDTAAYFDGAMCVEGSSSFAFSPKPAEEGVWADYSAVSTISGFSSYTNKWIYTKKIGKTVFVSFRLTGTSNASAISFTVPYASASAPAYTTIPASATTNGTQIIGMIQLASTSQTVACYSSPTFGGWTNGTSDIMGGFFYESA